jgi:hypothetical protein
VPGKLPALASSVAHSSSSYRLLLYPCPESRK